MHYLHRYIDDIDSYMENIYQQSTYKSCYYADYMH